MFFVDVFAVFLFVCLLLLGFVSEFLLLFLLFVCLFVCCCCFCFVVLGGHYPLRLYQHSTPQPRDPGSSIPYARSPEGRLGGGGGSENAGRLPSA